jgi:hypothetical protein
MSTRPMVASPTLVAATMPKMSIAEVNGRSGSIAKPVSGITTSSNRTSTTSISAVPTRASMWSIVIASKAKPVGGRSV